MSRMSAVEARLHKGCNVLSEIKTNEFNMRGYRTARNGIYIMPASKPQTDREVQALLEAGLIEEVPGKPGVWRECRTKKA